MLFPFESDVSWLGHSSRDMNVFALVSLCCISGQILAKVVCEERVTWLHDLKIS